MPRTKLSYSEGMGILTTVGESHYYPERFGQALYNAVAKEFPDVAKHQHGTEHDFFYWLDDFKVMNTFTSIWMENSNA